MTTQNYSNYINLSKHTKNNIFYTHQSNQQVHRLSMKEIITYNVIFTKNNNEHKNYQSPTSIDCSVISVSGNSLTAYK